MVKTLMADEEVVTKPVVSFRHQDVSKSMRVAANPPSFHTANDECFVAIVSPETVLRKPGRSHRAHVCVPCG